MIIKKKRKLELLKIFIENGLEKLNQEHDSLFDLPEDPENKLEENNLNIKATEELLTSVNRNL
jgi:hypothetical protein